MSYSRWGPSRWYTFRACQDDATENRETAIFEVCAIASFTAAELRADIEKCLDAALVRELQHCQHCGPGIPGEEREELKGYMLEFLTDVDRDYPDPTEVNT